MVTDADVVFLAQRGMAYALKQETEAECLARTRTQIEEIVAREIEARASKQGGEVRALAERIYAIRMSCTFTDGVEQIMWELEHFLAERERKAREEERERCAERIRRYWLGDGRDGGFRLVGVIAAIKEAPDA